ncbi:MAG TPA: hypothetical protein VFU15_10260 [Bacteroidia bacterium]|nr:hypothetical protein [Bacteroidia bacterium]
MLSQKDIELLSSVFATKDDMQKLASNEDVKFLRSNFQDVLEGMDKMGEKTEKNFDEVRKDINELREMVQETITVGDKEKEVLKTTTAKHEKWIKQLAGNADLALQ